MSRIENIIKEKCPLGVKYYKLSEIGKQFNGLSGKTKNDFDGGNCRYISYMNIYNNPSVKLDEDDYVFIAENEKQNEIHFKDILVAGSSENLEDSGMISVVTNEPKEKIYLNSFCFGFRLNSDFYDKCNADYLKHIFRSKDFRDKILSCSFGVTRYNLSKDKFLKLTIPIPPIEIQEEIVKILDKFGELEAELEAELETRKSQYEFWRGKLLSSSTKLYKLDDIAKFTYGYTDKALDSGDARYIRITDISEDGYLLNSDPKFLNITDDNKKYILNKGDIVVARTGASFGKTLYFNDDYPGIYASFLIKIDLDNNVILNRYYWHYSKSSLYWNQANNLVSRAGQPQFNSNAIKKIEINLPSIEEQQKIIDILDKFELLINDISEGLPAEIEARRKQYEYYRDKLLSFEEMIVNE